MYDEGKATFDEELMRDGLELSLIGMGVVFSVLSVLAVFIKIFDLVDARMTAGDAPGLTAGTGSPSVSATASPAAAIPEPDDSETAAVIAVALALADAERGQSAGAASNPMHQQTGSSWLSSGRSREMASRMIGQPRRGYRNS